MTFFLAALSASEIATVIFPVVLSFLAILIAASSLLIISLFTDSLTLLPLRALLAVFVTGIYIEIKPLISRLLVYDKEARISTRYE